MIGKTIDRQTLIDKNKQGIEEAQKFISNIRSKSANSNDISELLNCLFYIVVDSCREDEVIDEILKIITKIKGVLNGAN